MLCLTVLLGCTQTDLTVATEPLSTPVAAMQTPTGVASTTAPTATMPQIDTPTAQPSPTATALPTATDSPTATPSAVATTIPDLYAGLGIEDLAARPYGGGELEIVDLLFEADTFKRYLITYPSDGLTIYGFMNVPNEGVKFPVALVLHGYIPPDEYQVETYTTRYADALAEAGYFVIHPNYRNFPPSDRGDDPFRIGSATDIFNLIGIIKAQSQDPAGVLRRADGENIHVMGHSMGGGMALRVATVWPDAVKAVVLYGAMSGDERLNYEQIQIWSEGRVGAFELGASAENLAQIAPINHLERITAPISVHHSRDDATVPVTWSEDLCARLEEMEHSAECYFYDGVPHTFNGSLDQLFIERMIAFFRSD
jgi:dipeptidyl aminopeptidase/acylaminoacyl peptidase